MHAANYTPENANKLLLFKWFFWDCGNTFWARKLCYSYFHILFPLLKLLHLWCHFGTLFPRPPRPQLEQQGRLTENLMGDGSFQPSGLPLTHTLPVILHGWKITIFDGSHIFKWLVCHCHVSFRGYTSFQQKYLLLHPIRTQTSLAIVAEAVTKGTTTEDMGEGVDGTQTMMVSSPAGRP